MIATILILLLVTAVSLAIALVVGWLTSPRTAGILYIIVAGMFGASTVSSIADGTVKFGDSWLAFAICAIFIYLGLRFIAEFPEY